MKILYLFPDPREKTLERVINGEAPSDRLYGLFELRKLGYDVSLIDSRPKGPLSSVALFINKRFQLNIKDLKTILFLRNYDVIVVVNEGFSTMITIACRIFGKKIVYLDALFRPPRNIVRKMIYKVNLRLSDGIVVYSKYQMQFWSKLYNVATKRFKVLPYTIDISFYERQIYSKTSSEPFILTVGRDQARDYKTLVDAMDGLGVNLKIVTLPYLLKDIGLNNNWIEFFEYIPYERLFQLYSDALFVVLPLKNWGVLYPSGIRGLLEAKELGKCVIASYSPVLEEYVGQEEGVLYVEPESVKELRDKILSLLENPDNRIMLEAKGVEVVRKKFNMDVFASDLGYYLSNLYEGARKGLSPH